MKSIFDQSTREEVIRRIGSLSRDNQPRWGKMNVTQMVRHCALTEEYYRGAISIKRSMLGRLIGRTAIKIILKDEKSTLRKNSPTSPHFLVRADLDDLEKEKKNWQAWVERYASFGPEDFTHWFFGKMTKTELGQFIYKHSDHHLRQFGA